MIKTAKTFYFIVDDVTVKLYVSIPLPLCVLPVKRFVLATVALSGLGEGGTGQAQGFCKPLRDNRDCDRCLISKHELDCFHKNKFLYFVSWKRRFSTKTL